MLILLPVPVSKRKTMAQLAKIHEQLQEVEDALALDPENKDLLSLRDKLKVKKKEKISQKIAKKRRKKERILWFSGMA